MRRESPVPRRALCCASAVPVLWAVPASLLGNAVTRTARIYYVALGSIAVACAVMTIKYAAYLMTGSVALFSDALESIVNIVTAVVALVAIRIGAKPADSDHPFGHHKAEYFSAVIEGVLIVVAALLIFREAYNAVLEPRAIAMPMEGIAVNLAATLMNGLWSFFLISRGRAWRSPALGADGRHLLTDVMTSVGVAAGLGLAVATGLNILDPALAALVAAHILWAGWRVIRESVSGLMDTAVAPEIDTKIRAIISSHADGALEVHDLKTRTAGAATFIEFHMVVPASMTVADAHDICDRVEDAVEAEIDGSSVLIHIEPEDKAKQQGVPVI